MKNRLVYIASPFSGDVGANLVFARKACMYALQLGFTPIGSHLIYPQFLDDTDPAMREQGIAAAKDLIRACGRFWLCGNKISTGMAAEKTFAESIGLPIETVPADLIENIEIHPTRTVG